MGKKRLLFLTLLMTICSCLFAQSYEYHYPYGYEFDNYMGVEVVKVSIDGKTQSSTSLEIGAFCEYSDEYSDIVNRGSAFVSGNNCWYIPVYGVDEEFFSFKLYDHSTGKEYSDFTINVGGSNAKGLKYNGNGYLNLEIYFKSPLHYVYEGEGGNNMAITAVVSIDGDEQKSDKLELGAFCGNEVRGSAKTDYYDKDYDRYFAAPVTVYGNKGEEISFKLYDHESGTEIAFNEVTTITFDTDADYGSVFKPRIINFVTKDYVAEIVDGDKYETLEEAVAEAQTGDEIKLLKDVTINESINVTNKITLNLNGKNITANFDDSYGAIYVKKDAELTITGEGDITSEGLAIGTYGTVNIEGGNITTTGSDDAALYVFYYQNDYEGIANIKGGSLNTVWNCGTLSVSGGKIDYLDTSSELNVTDGVITKMYAKDGSDASGAYEMYIENIETTVPTVEVPENYKFVEISENVYQVVAKVYVAQVGDKKFESFDEALAYAKSTTDNDAITILKTIVLSETKTIDFENIEINSTVNPAFRITDGATVTVENGNMDTGGVAYNFILGASDDSSAGNLTIKSGKYHASTTVASVTKGNLVIEGGEFSATSYNGDCRFLINCIDANYNADPRTANVEIKGGMFHNFDPENNLAEGAGTNFCAEGYLSVDNGDGTWTVRQGVYVAQVGDKKFESFDEAFAYAKSTTDNDAITILKTIVLSETKTIDFENIEINSTVNPAFRITDGATVTVENGNMDTGGVAYNFILGASDDSSAGNLTIKSGKYHASTTVASVTKGNLVIEGGEFSATSYNGSYAFLINCIDANYTNGSATVSIIGGTFHNWNPQDNAAEGTGTDFCHADYAATETAANVWTVHQAVAKIDEARFATLQDAVNAADATNNTIDLIADVQLDAYVTISKSVNLNLAQFNITRENGTALYVNGENIEVNINGKGTVSGAQAVYVDNGTVTIDGGNYVGGYEAVYVINNGHAVINGGTFGAENDEDDTDFVLNEYDATRDITTIAVYGGTFVGFDPENNAAEGAGTNFCAEGYVSDDNGNGTWTVRPGSYVAKVGDVKYETVAAAVAAATAGETVELLADVTEDVTVGKSLTIDGANFKYTGNISVSGTSTAMTVKNVNFIDGTGYAVTTNRIKSITVENCTATNYGYGFLYANKSTPTVVVKNVTVDGGNYGFHWVYGTTATLENVTMTNVTNGLYIQNYASKTINVKNSNISSIAIWERENVSGVQTFNFEGASTVGSLTDSQYAKYVLAATDATLKAEAGKNVETIPGYKVVYDDVESVYSVEKLMAYFKGGAYSNYSAPKNREHFGINLYDVYALNSLVVKVYHNDDLLLTTTLREYDLDDNTKNLYPCIVTGEKGITVANVVNLGEEGCKPAGSWENVWNVNPTVANVPNRYEVYVDGVFNDELDLTQGEFAGFSSKAYLQKYLAFKSVYKAASVTRGEDVTYYMTLAEAWNDATQDGDVVTLYDNAELASRLDVTNKITLNLNGKNITANFDDSYGAIYVKKDAELTITGEGDITSEGLAIGTYGTVNIEGGNITTTGSDDAALYVFYYQNDYEGIANIKGGSLNTVWNCGTLSVSGGKIDYLDTSSELNVTDGVITKMYAKDGSDASGVYEMHIENIETTVLAVEVPEDYKFVEIRENVYQVVAKNYVAQTETGSKFETLKEAIDAANETVTLLQPATGAGVVINKDITIDFGGFTYSFNEGVGSGSLTSNGFQLLGGNVVLKNGTLKVADADASEFYILVQNYTNLTVEDMTLDGTNLDKWSTVENNWDSYTLSNNSGEVNIINTKIYANNEGVNAFAFDVDDNASYTSKPVVNVSGENTLVRGNVEVDLPENLNISGGLFTNEIEDEWCAEGYIPTTVVVDEITYYTVKLGEYVAQVGDKKFESFDEAFAYAKSTTDNDAITILKTIVLSADQEINFENIEINSTVNPAFRITDYATVTVKNGNMDTEGVAYNFILGASDGSSAGNLVIESGKYQASITVASVTKGNLVIEGGEFSATSYNGSYAFLINCIDANYKNGSATVSIIGGTFHNWNPQDNAAEGTGTDFCHADYAATETAANVWTVLPAVAKIDEARFATLQDAVNAADATNNTIDLLADVQLDAYVTISKSVNLNLAQFNITRENGTALYVNGEGIEVTIDGEGTVSGAQAVYVDNGTVTIDGGNYVGHHAVYVINNGHAVINDGTFKAGEGSDADFLLNEYDATRDITTIAVKGGTFHGFDPENNAAEGAGTNFCAEGYVSDDKGNGIWTVRPAAYVAQVNDGAKYESLVEAYDAAQSGDVVTLLTDATGAGLKINKDITIDFGGYTYTINQAVGSNNTESQGFQLLKNNTVTLKNGNIAIAENTNVKWMFNAYANVTIENVNVNCANMAEPAENEKNYVLVVNNGGGATPTVTYSGVSYTDFPGSNAALYVDPSTKLVAEAGLNVETCNGYVVVYNNGAYIAIPEVSEEDAVAKIGEILFKTFAEAYETAVDGDEIVILQNITFNSIVEIHKNITIDINGDTLTGTAEKFFRVFADVTFENGNIVNNTNNGRCVETRTGNIELNLNNVSLIAENGASQPLTIGGSGDNIAVNINASVINAGKYGYAVIVFNPVQMNIESSTVEGWSALYFKGEDNSLGSAGSVVNVNDSEITGTNHVSASDPTNTFATIQFEDENVTLNVNGDDSRIRAYEEEHNHQYVFALPETNDIKVNVENTVIISAAHFLNCDLLGNAEIILPKFYKEDINEEGYWAEDYGNDQVIVRQQFIAVASIGETLYQSLEEAVEAAVAGNEIVLLRDVETKNYTYDLTDVTLNLNTKTISTQSLFLGDNYTITNGTSSYGLNISGNNVMINNVIVNGSINVNNASVVTLANNTVNATDSYAVYAGENVTDLEIKSGTYYGAEGFDAVSHVDGSIVTTTGGTYNSNVELAGYCPDGYYAKDNGNGTWTVIRSAVLDVDLAKGWNWFSSYVNIDGTQGWSLLTNALTGFGIEIKDQYNQVASYNNIVNRWTGTLTSTSTNQMYKIYTTQPGNVYIEGTTVEGVEITLYSGSNWIAYPVDKPLNIVDALRDFTPTPGDQISTLTGFVEYMDYSDIMGGDTQYNGWYDANYNFNTFTFVPGQGYMYYSNATNPVTFTYNTDAPAATAKSDSDSDRFWNVNPHMYPSNMVITAVLNVDGELAEGNYEIAAFCNGECRGSGKLVYCKPLDQYIVRILVHGNGVENLTFKCYDIDADMVYELDNMVVYSDNARLGSMKEPYLFNRNTTGVDENSSAMINIYPNPTTTNSEINLNAVCDKVEVFNALGVKIAEYDNVDSIDPLQTAGVYVIRVSNNDDVTHCRLVVK